jgi:hypothetical protein
MRPESQGQGAGGRRLHHKQADTLWGGAYSRLPSCALTCLPTAWWALWRRTTTSEGVARISWEFSGTGSTAGCQRGLGFCAVMLVSVGLGLHANRRLEARELV